MVALIATRRKRLLWSALAFVLGTAFGLWLLLTVDSQRLTPLNAWTIMNRLLVIPVLLSVAVLSLTTACVTPPTNLDAPVEPLSIEDPGQAFTAQVVGLQWLNPLQRKDYSTEWQLLWTLGLARANKNDSHVSSNPKKYGKLQAIGIIAYGHNGKESFQGYHEKYVDELLVRYHDFYFSTSDYFYNVHTKDTKRWRELAGIHIEYALPAGRLDPVEAAKFTTKRIADLFEIGNVNSPTLWTRNTPPDVHITTGGPNAGFTSLSAALAYLKSHPTETVWAMNWDAPNFPPDDEQINENMVLLILAGPHYNTEREPLAWIGFPASHGIAEFEAKAGGPTRAVQAWTATLNDAAANANKLPTDIHYAIHDAGNASPASPDRIGPLAQTLTTQVPEFDFIKQTFNMPALLGETGAGTALTDVALAIGYANHLGKNVLVAGTTDAEHLTAVMVTPPAKGRSMDLDKDWFRARSGRDAFLPWWGLRHDAPPRMQGFSD